MQPGRGESARRGFRARVGMVLGIGLVVIAGLLMPVAVAPAAAADLSQFDPGNIVSDAVFFNTSSMSQSQIQSFLQAKEPTCAASAICVKDYYTVTKSVAADPMCGAYSGGSSERASAIIYKVAQACGINPQVLIVTMQKEQGLITSVWPSDYAYAHAMGADCPDTTGCNSISAGFFAQVYKSAWQFKRYANPSGTSNYFTWYAPGHTWNIQYNPNAACGTKAVYVKNQATADLYYYTPYTPNAAALAAGYGTGDSCSAYGNRNFYNYFTDWFGSTQGASGSPFGNVEAVIGGAGAVQTSGWAIDPNTAAPISIRVDVDGTTAGTFAASSPRNDVGAAYPAFGADHGFGVQVAVPNPGSHNVCIVALNTGAGYDQLLQCQTVTVTAGQPPFGNLESLSVSGTTATATGWAIDPDTTAPIQVQLTAGTAATQTTANLARSDVGAAYPTSGPDHGFNGQITLPPLSTTTVCATAVDNSGVGGTSLGCQALTSGIALPAANVPPIGNFESAVVSGNTVTVGGWALDQNVTTPIAVHVYVDSVGTAFVADAARTDVGAAFPGYGNNHGFGAQVPATSGTHQVCVYAIDSAGGPNTSLGCRKIGVQVNKPPYGNSEALFAVSGGVTASGWAIDPDTTAPISVDVQIDGVDHTTPANLPRADVAAAYPGTGPAHGYATTVSVGAGAHRVCIYAIDSVGGPNTTLTCVDLVVP